MPTYEFEYLEDCILPNIPVTQVYIFCFDEQGKFCVVRDSGEVHYSLPGGGVEPGESPEVAARRELMEESQVTCGELMLLGTNVVSGFNDGEVVEKIQQVRYLSPAIEIPKYIKNYNGFETEERQFVSFTDLPKYVTWLSEPMPQKMMQQVLKKIKNG